MAFINRLVFEAFMSKNKNKESDDPIHMFDNKNPDDSAKFVPSFLKTSKPFMPIKKLDIDKILQPECNCTPGGDCDCSDK